MTPLWFSLRYFTTFPSKVFTSSRLPGYSHCIRYKEKMAFKPLTPFCKDCYGVWAGYKNPDHIRIIRKCTATSAVIKPEPVSGTRFVKIVAEDKN